MPCQGENPANMLTGAETLTPSIPVAYYDILSMSNLITRILERWNHLLVEISYFLNIGPESDNRQIFRDGSVSEIWIPLQ